jgi:homoserine kinase
MPDGISNGLWTGDGVERRLWIRCVGVRIGLAGRRGHRAANRLGRDDRRHQRRWRQAAARCFEERALLDAAGEKRGVALRIRKGLPLASGLGGSAASAAAAVVAVDALYALGSTLETLVTCALEGERLGAGSAHADNIAPSICGGFVLVRRSHPPDIVRLPVPAGLTAVVVHPDLEIETAMARKLLGDTVALKDAIQQWANLGAFVDGLHRGDFDLIARSLEDRIAEPRRAPLVPGLAVIKQAALEAGALGCSLSGSGPSLFALCRSADDGERVAAAMTAAVGAQIGGETQTYVSSVAPQGARLVPACDS